MSADLDTRWLAAAAALGERARPLSRPNPAVGALIVKGGRVVGRGWTQPGGRPHAEAMALAHAGSEAAGATLYVTLEPCAHRSERGPACSDLVLRSNLARVVLGVGDPDTRTAGQGLDRLRKAGVETVLAEDAACRRSLEGYLKRAASGLPHVTLKLALTADGLVARADGSSKWITGEAARAHVHRERARADAILVGRGTLAADAPRLNVRLAGLEQRSPERLLLTSGEAPAGWTAISEPCGVAGRGLQYLFVEGGAQTAAAFVEAGLVDRMLLYRAPVTFGEGISAFRGRRVPYGWHMTDRRQLGSDILEVYEQ